MAVMQYIGARYVPKFFDNPAGGSDWVEGVVYEPLTVVTYMQSSYTSKKTVPATIGAPNLNLEYWAPTGNYNAQVEEYRRETAAVAAEVAAMEPVLEGIVEDVSSLGTRIDGVDGRIDNVDTSITKLGEDVYDIENSFTTNDNGSADTAVTAYNEGTLFYWNGVLFYATEDIAEGAVITEGVNAERFNLSEKVGAIDEELEKVKYKDIGVRKAYYVNAQTGSDDNEGTEASPFQTIQKAYEESLTNGYYDVNIYLMSAGNYYLDDRRITNLSMHILGRVAGVKLKIGDGVNYTPYIYNCYLHIEGQNASNMMELYCPRGLHGNTAFYYIKWCVLKSDDGYDYDSDQITLNEVEIDANVRVVCANGFLNFQGNNIVRWRPGAVTQGAGQLVFAQNAFVSVFGTWTYTPLTANVPADIWIFDFQNCVVSMQNRFADLSSNGYKFTNHAVRLRYCWATFRDYTKNDIKNTSLLDTNIPDGGYSTMLGSTGNEWIR